MLSRALIPLARILHRWANLEEEYRRDVLSLFERNPEARLLDLGCGSGEFTLRLARRIGTRHVFGVDIIEENVVQARAHGIHCYQANLDQGKLPFEDETFDAVCLNHVLEHVADTDGLTREIYRVLVTGGYAVISTPNLAAWHTIAFLLCGLQPYYANVSDEDWALGMWVPWIGDMHKRKGTYPQHRRVFTMRSLRDFLSYHGLTSERELTTGFCLLCPALAARILTAIDQVHGDIVSTKARKARGKDGAGK